MKFLADFNIWVYNTVLLDAYYTQTSLFCPIAFS